MRNLTRVSALTAVVVLAAPLIASAQDFSNITHAADRLVTFAIGFLIALAVVVFFWGIVKYLFSSGTEAKASGMKILLFGIIALFVMLSIYGLVRLLQNTFGVQNPNQVPVPQVSLTI